MSPPLTQRADPYRTIWRWRALGSACELQIAEPDWPQTRLEAVAGKVRDWVENFEMRYSRFRPESLLRRLNASAGQGWIAVDAGMEAMLDLCDRVVFLTRGVLDPTALPLIQLYYRREAPPTEDEVAAALPRIGWSRVERRAGAVRLPAGMCLDFGGFGKEFAVDEVATLLETEGVGHYLVNLGQDLRMAGAPVGAAGWIVGLEDPKNPDTALTRVALSGGGVAASGDYRRLFVANGRRYGHIVDPRTGYPVANRCRAVHVIAGTCLEAGLHSTSAFILGIPDGLDFLETTYGVEGLIVTESAVHRTNGFTTYEIR